MRLEFTSDLPVDAEQAFAWHTRPGAFARLVPPWQRVRLLGDHPGIADGSIARLELRLGPIRQHWVARHRDVVAGRQFVDEQISGPFAIWHHAHRFEPLDDRRCRLVDDISCTLPAGPLGGLAAGTIRRSVSRAFRYRHAVTAADLAFHAGFREHPRITVAMTGASGLVGRMVAAMLTTAGHRVIPLVRGHPGPGERRWTPGATLDPATFLGVDAVVHLAGESIASGRWSAARKAAIRTSRIAGTTTLVDAILKANPRPAVFVGASATGYYGDRGDHPVTEAEPPGRGFLGDLAAEWEGAARPLAAGGVRTVTTRFGIVLSPAGGALRAMLPPFQLGAGGRLGSGNQWMSWVSIDDCAAAVVWALLGDLHGPVNVTAPEPVTNRQFTETLGRVLRRPTLMAVPAAVLRLALGELADEALLTGARVLPGVLTASGYQFRHPGLKGALRHVLGRAAR